MAKVTARISGVIVDNFYDDPFFEDIINKGIITPASRFIFQVAQATDELEVRINSFGGDVFSGNSMIIALRSWASAHQKAKLSIVVEAIALSAAANILAMAPKSAHVSVYENSLVMYHSCSTLTAGGPGAHKDAAALMEKVNNSIISMLEDKTTLDMAKVTEWFQESRMGWLDAKELVECKLADDIIDGESAPAPHIDETIEDSKLVAFYQGQQQLLANFTPAAKKEASMPKQEEENKEKEEEKKDQQPTQEDEGKKDEGEGKKDEQPKQEEGKKDEEDKKECEQLKQENAQLKQELEDLKQQLAASQEKIQKLTAGFRHTPSAQTPTTFQQKVEALKGKSPADWDAAFIALMKEDPEGYKQYMNKK